MSSGERIGDKFTEEQRQKLLRVENDPRRSQQNQARVWRIRVMDGLNEGKIIVGQFEGTDVQVGPFEADYSSKTSIGRQKPILQYVGGKNELLTYNVMFFGGGTEYINRRLDELRQLTMRDRQLGRPPVLNAQMPGGHLQSCVLRAVSNIQLGTLMANGTVRFVNLTLSFEEHVPFRLRETIPKETRYHRARTGDTFEALARLEYGDPMLGIVLAHRHPDLSGGIPVGTTVKLPSYDAIKRDPVVPTSVALKNLGQRYDSEQAVARDAILDRHEKRYISRTLPRGI
jgi:hypothetical protein